MGTRKNRASTHNLFLKAKFNIKKNTSTNNVYPCTTMPSGPPSLIFHSDASFKGQIFPFLLECIKASFYIYSSCKYEYVRFNAKKSMIKFDFTTFIPISKLIDNDACQVFI